jgi:hypothetical protein
VTNADFDSTQISAVRRTYEWNVCNYCCISDGNCSGGAAMKIKSITVVSTQISPHGSRLDVNDAMLRKETKQIYSQTVNIRLLTINSIIYKEITNLLPYKWCCLFITLQLEEYHDNKTTGCD